MQEEQVSQSDSVGSAQSVDLGRRKALVRLGTYSALATPAVLTLLTEKSAANTTSPRGGGTKPPKPPKEPKPPKKPK